MNTVDTRSSPLGAPGAASPHAHGARRWVALAVLLLASFLALTNVTSANVALPAIQHGLGGADSTLSLVLTGYALAFGLALIPAGRLGDAFGHKKIFIVGVAVFALANLWAGSAGTVELLIAARVLSGVGAAFAVTPIAALIQIMFAGPERARPFGIMGAVIGLATALGPLISGGLITAVGDDLGWRLSFFVSVPIAVIAIVMAAIILPAEHIAPRPKLDAQGLLLLLIGLAALMTPLSQSGVISWWLAAVLVVVGAIALIALFTRQSRRERAGDPGLIPPSLFRSVTFSTGLLAAFFAFAAFTGSFLVLALLWQRTLSHSALDAGLLLLPYAAGSFVGSILSRRTWQRMGRHSATLGLIVLAVGLAAVATALLVLPTDALTIAALAAPLAVVGAGTGLFVGPNTNATIARIERRYAGVASGLVATAQRLGTAVGVALMAAIIAVAGESIVDQVSNAAGALFVTAGAAVAAIIAVLFDRSEAHPHAPGGAPGRPPVAQEKPLEAAAQR